MCSTWKTSVVLVVICASPRIFGRAPFELRANRLSVQVILRAIEDFLG
jgi:hypothetical protein